MGATAFEDRPAVYLECNGAEYVEIGGEPFGRTLLPLISPFTPSFVPSLFFVLVPKIRHWQLFDLSVSFGAATLASGTLINN